MSLATTTDIAAKLGRDLGTAETTAVEYLLTAADAVIAHEGQVSLATLATKTDPILPIVAAEIVCRAMANPQGVASLQEQLGQYGNTVRFRDLPNGGGLWLTESEGMLVRQAIHGTLSGGGHAESLAEHLDVDLVTNRLTIYTDAVDQN